MESTKSGLSTQRRPWRHLSIEEKDARYDAALTAEIEATSGRPPKLNRMAEIVGCSPQALDSYLTVRKEARR